MKHDAIAIGSSHKKAPVVSGRAKVFGICYTHLAYRRSAADERETECSAPHVNANSGPIEEAIARHPNKKLA